MKPNIDTGCIIPFGNEWAVVTQRDFQLETAQLRVFKTTLDAHQWKHDQSLKQLPDWHKAHCKACKYNQGRVGVTTPTGFP